MVAFALKVSYCASLVCKTCFCCSYLKYDSIETNANKCVTMILTNNTCDMNSETKSISVERIEKNNFEISNTSVVAIYNVYLWLYTYFHCPNIAYKFHISYTEAIISGNSNIE